MTQQEFINQIAPLLQKYAKKYGYKVASAGIAQACLESGYGTSNKVTSDGGLHNDRNNYFGLKCGSSWSGKKVRLKTKEEYQKGV